ncbi:hypothetical protein M378DRAFT_453975 [Amanita muscaria Koide BX008]|uniref:Uncharacterized protein n=1 Tax=Amanita muscaria (strain Koide BX008) TaxID=946122 RepID=A0A0C2WKP1_AMAMK|nr:hypothetical protein M378DRAFT_453975 [Amanita muscaria Koide BX008]
MTDVLCSLSLYLCRITVIIAKTLDGIKYFPFLEVVHVRVRQFKTSISLVTRAPK